MEIIPDMYSGTSHFCDERDPIISLTASDHLTQEQRDSLNEVIGKDFTTSGENGDHLSKGVQTQENKELDKMLKDGVVEISNSLWALLTIGN